jgi:imidazolonepropionase-like amidohydrolase
MQTFAPIAASLLLAAALPATAQASADNAATTLIRNVRVWDGTASAATAPQDLLIRGHLIDAIGSDLDGASATRIIDGAGRMVIPGIIEAHTHVMLPISPDEVAKLDPGYVSARAAKEARGMLMRGWTTIRDMGGPSQGLAKAIDEGHAIGPRIYSAAIVITQTSGHGDARDLTALHPNMGASPNALVNRYYLIADGPNEVLRAVRESLRQGATSIKVMAGGGISSDYDPIDTVQYTVEELRAAVTAAEQWNTYVSVHAYTDEAVRNALEAGVKVIEHGHLLTEDTLKLLRSKGAYLSSQSFGFVRSYLKPNVASNRGSKAALVMDGIDNLMTTAKRLGIPVAFGTDSFGSPEIYAGAVKEFGYRLKWFSSEEILKQATSVNAELLALTGPRNPYPDGPLGVLVEGAYADLLIVEGNPLEDVTLLEDYETNIRVIMKDGTIYKDTL